MAPSGRGPQLEQGRIRPAFQHPECQPRLLAPLLRVRQRSRLVGATILLEPIDPDPFLFARGSLHDRPVDLLDGAGAELRRQSTRGLAGPGQEDYARGRPIEPMDQPDVDVPRLAVSFLEIPACEVYERLRSRFIAL